MHEIIHDRLNTIHEVLRSASSEHNTFFNGKLGVVYYYYNAYLATGDSTFYSAGEKMLEEVFADLNSGSPGLIGTTLASGGAGLGWVVNWLSKENLISFEVDNEFEELEKYLFNTALAQIEEDTIDYLHGALGVLHYFNDRGQTPVISEYINTLVKKVIDRAVFTESGAWFRNYVIRVDQRNDINFGLAHGLTGILMILINSYPHTRYKEEIRHVVSEGIRFMLRHKMDVDFSNDEYNVFPFSIKQGATELSAPNRIAWCYGDLAEVLLFYRAHRLFGDPQWLKLADVIGTQTLLRKTTKATLMADSHFCHGSSGLAQFYKAVYEASGNPVYLKGYEYWIEQTIIMLDNDLEKGTLKGKEHNFLDGLIGPAFTLMTYVSDKELKWSKALLL